MPAPSATPDLRGPAEVASADTYSPGQRVWVYRGSWRPGVVLAVSALAVAVRYQTHTGRGTGVDTALAGDLATRDEPDPVVDGHDDD